VRRLRISVKSGWSVNQLLFLGSPSLASFPGMALAVGVAQVGDGEFGVVFEGVETIEIGSAIEIERKRDDKESQRKAISPFQCLECPAGILSRHWNFRSLWRGEHLQLRRLQPPTPYRITLSINAL